MQFPIFIHKEKDSDYGVIVPDLPGCYSAGNTIEEAIHHAKEAIECHLEGLLLDSDPIPLKKTIEQHIEEDPDLEGSVLALVEVDLSNISGNTIRINVSMPERFLIQIDEFAQQHGGNRSGFLVDAAMNYMAQHQPQKQSLRVNEPSSTYYTTKLPRKKRKKN